jgi:hypothetical protein
MIAQHTIKDMCTVAVVVMTRYVSQHNVRVLGTKIKERTNNPIHMARITQKRMQDKSSLSNGLMTYYHNTNDMINPQVPLHQQWFSLLGHSNNNLQLN